MGNWSLRHKINFSAPQAGTALIGVFFAILHVQGWSF
jgi:hypothetical protein